MEASFGLIMLLGRYLFLGLVYLFLYWAFRGMLSQMRAEQPVSVGATGSPAASGVAAPPRPAELAVPPTAVAPATQGVADSLAAGAVAAPEQPAGLAVAPALARLVVLEPGSSDLAAGHVINLTAALTIGRGDDNGLVIRDKFCSQHHAMIFLQQGRRLLRDRNSTNGTFHNGQQVLGDVELYSGDRINIGTVSLQYHAAG